MARQTIQLIKIIDDVTGEELDESQLDTVTFAIDGIAWQLDTNEEEGQKIREFLARYVSVATRVGAPPAAPDRPGRAAPSPSRQRRTSGEHPLQKVRTWAQENGYEVGDVGRVPLTIKESYAKNFGISVSEIG
ncbi:Lsr2 family protein [Kitasatospora sp. NPDC001309]|uniref:histone-like nucleoid-structuring protein Lsr2 n=1 Tax=Kitasatospora sp. NPDC001309 TaxID=3364013 RepID=UPI0036CF90C2